MGKRSAGLLMYRHREGRLEVFLVHPGGPFWNRKDLGAWTIPKGEYAPEEDALTAAKREFQEETGLTPSDDLIELSPITQRSGKVVRVWAFEGDADPDSITSNTFELEWPPASGRYQSFPEVDRAAWFDLEEAERRIVPAQVPLLLEVQQRLGA